VSLEEIRLAYHLPLAPIQGKKLAVFQPRSGYFSGPAHGGAVFSCAECGQSTVVSCA
jgi:hypothetical protein